MPHGVCFGTATGDLPLDQAAAQDVTRRIDVPDLVEQLTYFAPPGPIQQQVVPLGDHQLRLGPDRDRVGDRLFGRAVEVWPEDRGGVLVPKLSQEFDERPGVERLWRALDRTEPEQIERLVRKMKSIERRDHGGR